MSDKNPVQEQTIDDLIEGLPERFPDAVEMIQNEIAPYLIECGSALKDHYIKVIKKKTKAASIKSVRKNHR